MTSHDMQVNMANATEEQILGMLVTAELRGLANRSRLMDMIESRRERV